MTVGELIEQLKDIPQDTEVVILDIDNGRYEERQVEYVDYLNSFNEVQLS